MGNKPCCISSDCIRWNVEENIIENEDVESNNANIKNNTNTNIKNAIEISWWEYLFGSG